MPPTEFTFETIPAGDQPLVLKHAGPISADLAEKLRHELESRLPGRKVIVLGSGFSIEGLPEPGQLARIEKKLDAALRAPDAVAVVPDLAGLVDHDLQVRWLNVPMPQRCRVFAVDKPFILLSVYQVDEWDDKQSEWLPPTWFHLDTIARFIDEGIGQDRTGFER